MNKEREEFKQKAKSKIDELFSEINKLETKKELVKDQAQSKYSEQIAKLKAGKAELEMKLSNLASSKDEKWADAKEDFEKAAQSFKSGVNELTSLVN